MYVPNFRVEIVMSNFFEIATFRLETFEVQKFRIFRIDTFLMLKLYELPHTSQNITMQQF